MAEENKFRELAIKIYDLDTKVYASTGSNIARVYHGDREKCIKNLADLLESRPSASKLRSELALISNMARTVKDSNKKLYKEIMSTYDQIVHEATKLQYSYDGEDIINSEIARLNMSNLANRFGLNDKLIICISSTYGSAGTDIGFKLADALRINFYDVSIMKEILVRNEEGKETDREVFDTDVSHSLAQLYRDFKQYHGLSRADMEFFNTSRELIKRSKEESFVVIGRFADRILTNNGIPHISIFITAPLNLRVSRIYNINKDTITYKQAAKIVSKTDEAHLRRYKIYTGKNWGTASNYDLTINSASYGIDGAVSLIMRIIDKYNDHNNVVKA